MFPDGDVLVDDVLRLVFELSVLPKPDITDSTVAPLQLTHVCQNWRAIALSMPSLWTSMRVNISKVDALSHWLARSGSNSLEISMFSSNPPNPNDIIHRRGYPPLNVVCNLIPWQRTLRLEMQDLHLHCLYYFVVLSQYTIRLESLALSETCPSFDYLPISLDADLPPLAISTLRHLKITTADHECVSRSIPTQRRVSALLMSRRAVYFFNFIHANRTLESCEWEYRVPMLPPLIHHMCRKLYCLKSLSFVEHPSYDPTTGLRFFDASTFTCLAEPGVLPMLENLVVSRSATCPMTEDAYFAAIAFLEGRCGTLKKVQIVLEASDVVSARARLDEMGYVDVEVYLSQW